jgi:DNA-binding winged helix-turn-helix (wHTH) protein
LERQTLQYAFEDCVLDDDRRELWRAASSVPVGPQVFDLLAYLIHNRERVVTQDDLLASVWGGRIVSDSTMRSHINAARGAIGDSGEAQRLIRTLPRKGFRFVGEVHERQTEIMPAPAADRAIEVVPSAAAEPTPEPDGHVALPVVVSAPGPAPAPVSAARRPRLNGVLATALIGSAAAALVIVAGLVVLFRYHGSVGPANSPAEHREVFDPTVVPFLTDESRLALASYSALPSAKALALSEGQYGLASGLPDLESAKKEALGRCERHYTTTGNCKIYATDMDVVWSRKSLPLPLDVDVHSAPLDTLFVIAELPLLNTANRKLLDQQYTSEPDHKALAIQGSSGVFAKSSTANRAEAIRITIERCADYYQIPCLLVSVDGRLTVRIPKSRGIQDTFMLTTATEMSAHDRERIGEIYRQKDWRALAHGKSGGWYPVANASSESAAVEEALASCAGQDTDCTIYAIGNFRVADKI